MHRSTRRSQRRPLAVVAIAALVTSLLPALAAADEHTDPPGARGVDRVCPAPDDLGGEAPAAVTDIDDTTHEDAIRCALDYGFARGFTDGTYRPSRAISRGQAASIATALIEVSLGVSLERPDDNEFPDTADTTHEDAIEKLAAAGVIDGRTDETFAPNASVTRGQMSRIVANAIDFADTIAVDGSRPMTDDTPYFDDVVGSTFEADIQALTGVGIVQGRTASSFQPQGTVTRGQMASFVMRTADYLDREQRFLPTAVEVTYTVVLTGENEVAVDEDGTVTTGVGEAGATAEAIVTVNAFNGTLDYELTFDEVTGPFDGAPGFHIHAGDLGTNGPIVADLAGADDVQAAADDDASVLTGSFVEADADLGFRFADLVEDPDLFYLNLHSDLFVPGAVRGQFPEGGSDLLAPVEFTLELTGEAEVAPIEGEAGATATAVIEVDAVNRTVTHTTDISAVTGPFDGEGSPGYHIHVGASDENGPVVLFLATAAELQAAADGDGIVSGVEEDVDPVLLRELIGSPASYYVNVHSDAHPGGAVRAQLDS